MASDLRKRVPGRLLRDRELLNAAFDGCGLQIPDACRKAGVPTNDTAAMLSFLGRMLMVAGAFCLPGPARTRPQSTADEASSWPSLSADEQLKMLKACMGMLTVPPPWRKESALASAHKPMLPAEMREWDGPCDLASCFGMLIIWAAYGFLTKANMLAASVQRPSAEPVATGLTPMYGAAHRLITDRLPLASRSDTLCAWLLDAASDSKTSARLMATRREFHGAIVIRLKDGRWVSLDPYMRNMAILEQHLMMDDVARRLLADPSAVEAVHGQSGWSEQPRLEQEFRTVRDIVNLAQTDAVFNDGMPLVQLAEALEALMTQQCQFKPPTADEILQRAIVTPCESKPPKDASALPDPVITRAIVASADSGSHRLVLRERILLEAWRGWVKEAWHAAQSTRTSHPHQAMMLSAPERTLGVWAVINLRHRLERRVLATDLLRYSGSDIVLYNALTDIRNGRANADEQRWFAKRQEHFRQMPPHLLHPLTLEAIG